ncbi:MAG TPA: lysine-2,3-aminomutase-like protein [Stellaceae bacterium]|nr:lysine-2,3-aminomutase-like protein [Stellaceae bacterium]
MSTPISESRAVRSPKELVAAGLVAPSREAEIEAVAREFSVAITPEMVALIDSAAPTDPIARQFVPDGAELERAPEELADPIGDQRYSPLKGIVHRYPDRVLLKPHHLCPVYCRFCFRREQVGPGGEALSEVELGAALDYIAGHSSLWEVILTGGDPLLLSPRRLAAIIEALDAIPHLGVIRIHTRIPVVDPDRVTAELVASLVAEKAVFVAIHANHPREVTAKMREACRRLNGAGIPLLSQTVLLKGVNDEAATLTALFRALVAIRVKPYYLHHPDLARGTAHFRPDLAAGRRLVRALRGRVSGLCQPTYVLDLPGGHGKVPVGPSHAKEGEGGEWLIEDLDGHRHSYPPSDIEIGGSPR